MPEDYVESELVTKINDVVRYAEKTFLAVLAGCVYTGLTIATTSDARLLTNSKSSSLPILHSEISIAGFYLVAPFLLLCVYIYLQIYLQRLWERLADAPAIFPDGRTLGMKASPWFFNGLLNSHAYHLREKNLPLARIQFWICFLLAWILLPIITLPAVWWRYLPKHDWFGTSIQISLMLIGIGFGTFTYLSCRSTLRNERFDSKMYMRRCSGLTLAAAVFFAAVSYGAFNGVHQYFTLMPEVQRGKGSAENIPDQSPISGPLEKWVPRLLSYFRSPFPYLVNAEVSQKPDNWDVSNLGVIRREELTGVNLRFANAANAFFANANLEQATLEWANLREADFRGAKLNKAKLNRAYMIQSRFEGAYLVRAQLNHAYVLEAKLENADLTGASLKNARLHGAQLRGATLLATDLREAQFQPANMG